MMKNICRGCAFITSNGYCIRKKRSIPQYQGAPQQCKEYRRRLGGPSRSCSSCQHSELSENKEEAFCKLSKRMGKASRGHQCKKFTSK